jgi:glycyl-tRNA synthetase beta chain
MSRSDDFLIELYTEEIPSFYQINQIEDWKETLQKILIQNLLEFHSISISGTSRRIYVLIHQLKEIQKSVEKKIKGPSENVCLKNGQPTNALLGFAKKAGVEFDKIIYEEIDGGKYATALSTEGGGNAMEILPGIFESLIKNQSFPRTMKWSNLPLTYARPIISYTVQYGTEKRQFNGGIWDIISYSKNPRGHFILGPDEIIISYASEYENLLQVAGITVNHKKRRDSIVEMLDSKRQTSQVIKNKKLLDEVNFLVEKPCVIRASFPREFLEMPDVVILSEMEDHQRYFGLQDENGKLINDFLIVANANEDNHTGIENIRKGNEKVLRARLSDGSYFFREDRKKKLADRVDDLKRIVFHEGMGNLYDKKERLKKIALILKEYIYPDVNREVLLRTCDLCKADLTTHLVYEFDHLQGQIGSIYAQFDNEGEETVSAIFEHYLPRNVNDKFPEKPLGVLLSVSDKLDNIISGHILGKQPTSSQDPLGLRRQTLYIIDMLIQNKISMPLESILKPVLELYNDYKPGTSGLLPVLKEFFKGRLSTIFEKDRFDKKLINAALGTENDNLYELHLKLTSMRLFKEDENFLLMMAAFKRMNNIVSDFLVKNPGETKTADVNEKLFSQPQEKRLLEIALTLSEMIKNSGYQGKYTYDEIFRFLASVKKDIDDFFDNVMVMHDDNLTRINRLSLLRKSVTVLKSMMNIELLQ